jgi:4-amino-4-deoxy-L-arabinose transferase-like glycosyltransferase
MNKRSLPLLIVGAAILLRLLHLGWGLPDIYEEATPFRKAWQFWQWGGSGLDFNPHFFNYPALTFYVQFLAQSLHFSVGHIVGAYPTAETYRAAFAADPSAHILVARGVNVLWDVGTVLFVFLFTRKLAGPVPGALASLLVAINPLHIRLAQMISVDAAMTCLALATLWVLLRLQEEGAPRWYYFSGVLIGCAAAAKYNGALLVLPLMTAHLLRVRTLCLSHQGKLLAALGIAALVFIFVNPFILMDFHRFLEDFGFERYHMEYGHFGITGEHSTFAFYVQEVFPAAGSIGLVALALTGMLSTPRKEWRTRLPLLVWLLVSLITVFSWRMRADRYLLPVLPLLAVWAAFGMTWIWSRLPSLMQHRTRTAQALLVLLAVAVIAEPVNADITYYHAATLPDTREVARLTVGRLLPPGAVVVMGPLGLTLKDPFITFPLPYRSVKFEEFAPFYDARWYQDCAMAVGSNFDLARFRGEPARFSSFLQYYYDSLEVRWGLAAHVAPVPAQRGPEIWLYVPREQSPTLFDADLFTRLSTVESVSWVRPFVGNLVAVLSALHKEEKVRQLLMWQVREYARRGLRHESGETAVDMVKRFPHDAAAEALRDSVAALSGATKESPH